MDRINYKHILWDWNGTLLDDVWLCIDIINVMLENRKKPNISLQQYRDIFDFPVKGYYRKVGFDFSIEAFDKLCQDYCKEYAKRVNECKLYKYTLNILNYLCNNNISQSILSTTEQNILIRMTDMFRVNHFFKNIIGQMDLFASGKIESGRKLLTELEIDRSKVLLIGDTTHDALVAKEIGIDCVLIAIGHHAKEKLKKTEFQVIDDISDIPHYLKNK
ncbi:MAG: HAD hydrolase-like protein [Chitinispirillia bacterium]|jgi:phosphoglycolate phosphatase